MANMKTLCCTLLTACLLLWLWPSTSGAAQNPPERGKTVYAAKCAVCHGEKGKGDGPVAASLPAKSTDFTDGKFWRGDAAKVITNSIQKGKGIMPPITMEPGEVKDVVDYMTRAFKP